MAGCFVGQMNAAWLVGRRGMLVDSTAKMHENRTVRERLREIRLIWWVQLRECRGGGDEKK